MKTRAVIVGLLLFGCLACMLTAATAKPAGEGAFLADYAGSVSQVIAQTEENRLVALRYAKHFGTDPSSVLTFFRNELVVDTLAEDMTVQLYYLDTSRNIVSKSVDFRAGTKVFANRAGAPVLEIGTGNPLGSTLSTAAPIKQPSTIVERVLNQPPTEISPASAVSEEAARAAAPPDSGTMVAAVPAAAAAASVASGAGGASLSGWIVPLGVAGAAVALAGGGSGSNSSVPGGDDNPLVPEPTSLVMLGSGLIAVSGLVIRRRR